MGQATSHDGLVRTTGFNVSENSRFLVWRYLDSAEPDGRLRRSLVRPVDNYFGPRKMGILILVFIVGGYISLAFTLHMPGLAILFVFYIFRGFAIPILKGYITK